MQPVLLTASEVAQLLRVRTARVYELIRRGLLPSVRIGRQVRVPLADLSRWIEAGGTTDDGATH
jgi:putative molybdopterin biosynthesis protein